jgi:hypothetical protein
LQQQQQQQVLSSFSSQAASYFFIQQQDDDKTTTTTRQQDNNNNNTTRAKQVQKRAQKVPRQKYDGKKGAEKCTFFACPTPRAPLYIGVSGANSLKLF